jgi:hypothetical protein
LKDKFTTFAQYNLNNLKIALVCKKFYDTFKITDNARFLYRQEKEERILKTIAMEKYGLTDNDLKNFNYEQYPHRIYHRTIIKLYKLTDIKKCAYKKYGSEYLYLSKIKLKQLKIIQKKELNKQLKEDRKNNLINLLTSNNISFEQEDIENENDIEYIVNRNERKKYLISRLNENGLDFNDDTKLYIDFIKYDIGDVNDIIEFMIEMNFLSKYTTYKHEYRTERHEILYNYGYLYILNEDHSKYIEKTAKIRALEKWCIDNPDINNCLYLPPTLYEFIINNNIIK